MHKIYSLLLIILLSGCATTQEQLAENNHTDSIVDANIVVFVYQEKIQGQIHPLVVDYNSTIDATKHATVGGPFEAIIATGLINIFSTASEINRMNKLVTSINNRTSDLDFKKDLILKLQEKCIFTTPERIVISNKKPEFDADLIGIIKEFDNDYPTIAVRAGYGFGSNYRVLIIDTAVSLWLDKQSTPAYKTITSYYSPPITPFIKAYIPSIGDALLLRINNKIAEKIFAPNLSLWSSNRASMYRKYYTEGINETAKMIVTALTKKHGTQNTRKKQIATYVDYHIPRFNRENLRDNTKEGRILEEENNRLLLITENGSLSSVYNGPVINPTKMAKDYRWHR